MMIHEGQFVKDGEYILWAWSLLEEQAEQTQAENEKPLITNSCLSCGTFNVDDNHECKGRQVA